MKFSYNLALPFLAVLIFTKVDRSEGIIAEMREKRRLNKDFMAAMHRNPDVDAARRKGRSKKLQRLQEDIAMSVRKLKSYNYAEKQQSRGQKRQYQQAQTNGEYGPYGWAYGMDEIPFDMASRSFKYSGCAAVKSFNEELAAENGNPLVIDTFAVFRLCPADKCNQLSTSGCVRDFGEYVVEMKTYLGYILDYYEDRYDDYCKYCYPCDWTYKAKEKIALTQCYDKLNQDQWKNGQQAQKQAWQKYYQANGGDMSGYHAGYTEYNQYNYGNGFNSYNQAYNGGYVSQKYHGGNSFGGQSYWNYNAGEGYSSGATYNDYNFDNSYNRNNQNSNWNGNNRGLEDYRWANYNNNGNDQDYHRGNYDNYNYKRNNNNYDFNGNDQEYQRGNYDNYSNKRNNDNYGYNGNNQEYQRGNYDNYNNKRNNNNGDYNGKDQDSQRWNYDSYNNKRSTNYGYNNENDPDYQRGNYDNNNNNNNYNYNGNDQDYQRGNYDNYNNKRNANNNFNNANDQDYQRGNYDNYSNKRNNWGWSWGWEWGNKNNINSNNNNKWYNNGQKNGNYDESGSLYGYYDEEGRWIDYAENVAGNSGNTGYWGADGIYYPANDDGYGQYMTYNKCNDGSYCDECEAQIESKYESCDDFICGDYYTFCTDYYGEQNDFDVFDYLECSMYENEYGDVYYIGPHCGSDHYTISLGVFSDENCLNYLGESVSVASVVGYGHSDDELFNIPRECISCDGTEDYERDEGKGIYGDYVSAPKSGEDGIVAMCSALYEGSAACNMHMSNWKEASRYMTQNEIAMEYRNCAFVDNLSFGAYDDSGEIMLTTETFDLKDWRNPQQYRRVRIPASQAILLALSIILVTSLLTVAVQTHRDLRRNDQWVPPRPDYFVRANDLGFVLGRTRPVNGALI